MSREISLIESISRELENPDRSRVVRWIGDDCAVVRADKYAVTSVDVMVNGVHFELGLGGFSYFDAGRRALAGALSDLAAMGVSPGEAYLGVTITEEMTDGEVVALHRGAQQLATDTATTIAGGDIVCGPALSIAATVTGWSDSLEAIVNRDGAQVGDIVGVTGNLGSAAGGLAILQGKASGSNRLIARYSTPNPRIDAGRALAMAGAKAMIDLSDGLATDATRLAKASNLELEVDASKLPIDRDLEPVARQLRVSPIELAATGGDDYELLFCISPDDVPKAEDACREIGVTWIGVASDGPPGIAWKNAPDAAKDWRGWEL